MPRRTGLLSGLLLPRFIAPASAQNEVTTRNGPGALNRARIIAPASNPFGLLNGPAYRKFGSYEFDPAGITRFVSQIGPTPGNPPPALRKEAAGSTAQ